MVKHSYRYVLGGAAIFSVMAGSATAQTPVAEFYGEVILLPKESGAKDVSRVLGEEISFEKFAFRVMYDGFMRAINSSVIKPLGADVDRDRISVRSFPKADAASQRALRDKVTTSVLVGQLWYKERPGQSATPENLQAFRDAHKNNPLFADLMSGEVATAVDQFGASEKTVEEVLAGIPEAPVNPTAKGLESMKDAVVIEKVKGRLTEGVDLNEDEVARVKSRLEADPIEIMNTRSAESIYKRGVEIKKEYVFNVFVLETIRAKSEVKDEAAFEEFLKRFDDTYIAPWKDVFDISGSKIALKDG